MSRPRPAPAGRGPGRSALRILITGASRGLGLEFTRRYLGAGRAGFATCRRPGSARGLHALRAGHRERLSILPLDVSDADSIRAAHRTVRRATDGLDVLINHAGIYSARGSADPAERLGRMRFTREGREAPW
ncbi:MAG TPA: SDR family NAD(P)-dependent oxidoreductase [Methylomirabilota bacterium]